LGTSDQDADKEYEGAADQDLEGSGEQRGVHVTPANPRDDRKFNRDNYAGDAGSRPEMWNEIGQGMAETAEGGHAAAAKPTDHRRAAAGERAVVGERLGEGHGDAGADRSGDTDEESRPGVVRGEGGREERRQGRDRTVHQSSKARLHILQHEHSTSRAFLLAAGLFGEDFLLQAFG